MTHCVDSAHDHVFTGRFLAGDDPGASVADGYANPTGGFVASLSASMSALAFVPAAWPSPLFPPAFPVVDDTVALEPDPNWRPTLRLGRGTDHLQIGSIEVVDGQVTLQEYAGYCP